MNAQISSKEIAEQYLNEMDEAERNGDYKSWMKRWKNQNTENFTEADLLESIKSTQSDLGRFLCRDYIGCVHVTGGSGNTDYTYAWKSRYEKAPAVTTVGIHEHEGTVYLNEQRTNYGDDNMYMLLLNSTPES